jgi:hypothetical protein
VAGEATAEDIEEDLEVGGLTWAVDDGEGAGAESGGDFAAVVAVGAGALHHHGGRGLIEAGEEFEEARAALFLLLRRIGLIEGEAEVDDSDVDGVDAADDFGRFAAGGSANGADPHGLEEPGEPVNPGLGLPAAEREEEIEASGRTLSRLLTGARFGIGVGARTLHCNGIGARDVPEAARWRTGAAIGRRAGISGVFEVSGG